ncbi:biotin/lipoyl-containing protein, partial [Blastomonas sp.]|uniref:biotin/lipoyl-containing protein n=1 Tax=Blastomonas sp. TaxID=1909299 RepID=UPI002588C4A5
MDRPLPDHPVRWRRGRAQPLQSGRQPHPGASVSTEIEIKVPDIGGHSEVPVIELLAKPGDTVAKDQGLITLESDKATMEVPSSHAGVLVSLSVKVGDAVSEGSVIARLRVEEAGAAKSSPAASSPAAAAAPAPAPAAAANPAAAAASTPAAPAQKAASASGREADYSCQLAVLGSGPGGYTAAFRGADLGLDVILIERYPEIGGVCLNVGCIPSKALLHAARVIDEAAHGEDFGVTFGAPTIDLDKLRAYKSKVVKQLNGGLAGMAKQRKVRTVTGTGRFISPNEIEVQTADGAKIVR